MNYSIFFFATFFCFLLYRNRMRLIQYCMRNVCLNQDYTHVFSLRATTISNDNSFVVVKKIVANLPVHISYFLNIKNRYRFSCIQRERVNGKRERENLFELLQDFALFENDYLFVICDLSRFHSNIHFMQVFVFAAFVCCF